MDKLIVKSIVINIKSKTIGGTPKMHGLFMGMVNSV